MALGDPPLGKVWVPCIADPSAILAEEAEEDEEWYNGGWHELPVAERRHQAWLRLPMSGTRLKQLEMLAPGWLVHRDADGIVDACLINLGGTPGGLQQSPWLASNIRAVLCSPYFFSSIACPCTTGKRDFFDAAAAPPDVVRDLLNPNQLGPLPVQASYEFAACLCKAAHFQRLCFLCTASATRIANGTNRLCFFVAAACSAVHEHQRWAHGWRCQLEAVSKCMFKRFPA